ncbi:MAG: CsiV family protein, partial [Woeseiaceae bacterium]
EEGLVFSDIPEVAEPSPDMSKQTVGEIPAIRRLDFNLLQPEQYTMRDIYSKLEKLDAYRPILHAGWTQTTVERDLTPPVRLRMLGNVPLRLDGDITLYLSRYLHLVVNLQLDAVSLQPVQGYSPQDSSWFDKPDLRPAPVRYRIFEDRIFKSGDLRYFDHPKFGVIVRITRYEPTENETQTGGRSLSAE